MDEGKTAGPPTMAGAHPRSTLRRVRSSPQDRPHSLPLRLPLPLSLRLQVQSSGCPIHRALCDGWDVNRPPATLPLLLPLLPGRAGLSARRLAHPRSGLPLCRKQGSRERSYSWGLAPEPSPKGEATDFIAFVLAELYFSRFSPINRMSSPQTT